MIKLIYINDTWLPVENEIFQLNNKIDELEAQLNEANDKIFELEI